MFKGELFELQKPAASFMCTRKRVLLAHEQGLGKTIISFAAAEKLFELKKAKHALVIGPSGSVWQWKDKCEEFTTTRMVLTETKKTSTRTYRPVGSSPGYWAVSWHLFRRDFNRIIGFPWDIVIADEAQEFKNINSKTSKLMKELNRKVKPTYKWALTGTAISTKLEELYNLFYWIDKDFLPPWPVFAENHLDINTLGMIYGYRNLKALNTYAQHRMDRKTHADAKGKIPKLMPPIVHKIPQDKAYEKAQAKFVKLLDHMVANLAFDSEGNLIGVPRDSTTAKAFHEVKQLLGSPAKLSYGSNLASSILAENPSNRIVFFSFYKDPLYALHKLFGQSCVLFTGDQDSTTKRTNIKAFLEEGGPRILLASNAGATGLDLYSANYIIHLDVPAFGILDQRTKRITRLSSTHATAIVHFLIVERSWEEFYYYVVRNIEKLASGALEGRIDEVTVRAQSFRQFVKGESEDVLLTLAA